MKDVPTFEIGDRVVDQYGQKWPVLKVRTEVVVEEFVNEDGTSTRCSYFPADQLSLLSCAHVDVFGVPWWVKTYDGIALQPSRAGEDGAWLFCPSCGERLPHE